MDAPCHTRCGTLKNPHCSKTMSAEHRSKFAALHWQLWRHYMSKRILEWDENHKQTKSNSRRRYMPRILPIRRKKLFNNQSQQLSSTELLQFYNLRLLCRNTTLELVSPFIAWRFWSQVYRTAACSDKVVADIRKSAFSSSNPTVPGYSTRCNGKRQKRA